MKELSSPKHSSIWRDSFTLIYIFIFIIGFFLRIYDLNDRPIHHDESLHGVYSLYYLFDPKFNFYKYNPLLHGPFLYHTIPWFFWLIDISKWTLRLPAVLIGSLLILTPLLFNKYLKKTSQVFFGLLIATGPTFIYWSRFMRHDSFVLFSLFLFFLALKLKSPIKSILIALALGIHFTTKENFFLHLIFLICLMGFEFFLLKIKKRSDDTLLEKVISFIKVHPLITTLSLATFFFIAVFYYSAGFVYEQGILDGFYRKSLAYWANQHQTERIPGPFIYTFLINSFYESWWLPFLAIHLFFFYKKQKKIYLLLFALCFIPGLISTCFNLNIPTQSFLSNVLKIKIRQDLFLFFPLIYHSIIGTSLYLLEQKKYRPIVSLFSQLHYLLILL